MISTSTPRWGRMDFAVAQRRDLSATAKVVYAILKCYENAETKMCNPTQVMIADDAGMSIASVKRAIQQLAAASIIEVEAMPGHSRYCYRFDVQTAQIDTKQTAQFDTTNSSICTVKQLNLIPQTAQIDTSPLYNDKKNIKEQEKNRKRNARDKQHDPDFIKPDPDQQRIAENLVARWDAKYPHTKILSDMVGDQMAFIQLQTIHKQSPAEIEEIIDANAESIKYWTRPKSLMGHIRNDDDQPLVWQRIKSDAMRDSQPPPKEPIYTRETGDQYKEIYARFAATGQI